MSEFTCQFCNKSFATKYNLSKHQKTTKKCLEIQNNTDITWYNCECCDYKSTNKENFNRHTSKCKKKEKIDEYKEIISEKDKEIIALKAKLETNEKTILDLQNMIIKLRPVNNNINNNNNNTYITFEQRLQYSEATLHSYEELKSNIPTIIDLNFTRTTLQSVENLMAFMCNTILSYNNREFYHCHDTKSSIFHKKSGNELVTDKKANELINDILPLITEKAQEIHDEIVEADNKSVKYMSNMKKTLTYIKNMKKIDSPEREACVKMIANRKNVTSKEIQLYNKENELNDE